MEIIHIILGKANPDRLNGVNKVVYNMATEQTKAGMNVEVWGITPDPTHDYPARNFTTRLFEAHQNPFSIDRNLKLAILAKEDAVFHLHGGWIPRFSALATLMQEYDIKYVFTPHGAYNTVAMQRSSWAKKIYFYLFEKKLLSGARKIHAIGESEVSGLNQIFPNQKSFLLPYGFEYSEHSVFHVTKNIDFTLGFVGRLDVYTKGLDLLVSAFERFQYKVPTAKLWIVGDGEGKDFLSQLIATKNIRGITLWGKKFGAEKDMLISKMHVFAHPSRNEGLPTAVLEAASFGVPAIVTQATNVAAYVQKYDCGVGIANENVDELERAMLELHANHKGERYHQLGHNCETMLKQAFAWPVLVQQYKELYA
ncbi:Glycosyltransferase involved in cell wall bisynthesis [Flexibacter flexilis DSM 6793]|uniref:Glycosyltransferase involved in cell wall bisynthesis n=1 Tax=Flexibacter flexilis DSM 6793 TaxID=927664 RepID=A0A1I1L1V0_9BACT|nr:glycosyltransferase [Flexibacter flexilis]SFC67014.1 Glycosyltransferase involved in cell wall bisynthesis [Flexibacter flexilis DSM 6793]